MSKLHRNITGIAARASDSFNQTRMTRAALLASTALVAGFGFAASVSSPAHANTISAPGAIIFENDPAGIWINPTDTPTTVTVDTGIDNTAGGNLLGTLGNGVFFWNGVSPTTVNVSSGIIVTGDGLSLLSSTGPITADGTGGGIITAARNAVLFGVAGEAGDLTVKNFTNISGGNAGIYSLTFGTTTITGNAAITGGTAGVSGNAADGIYVNNPGGFGGNVLIDGNGPITGFDDGIEAYSLGTMTVTNNGAITGGGSVGTGAAGVYTRTTVGATLIDNNGHITGPSWNGVDAASTTGNITVTNNSGIESTGPGFLDANQMDGVHVLTLSGNVLIQNNQNISGADDGIEAYTGGAGIMSVLNNGNITGGAIAGSAGVYTRAGTGATVISNNGDITGPLWNGIDAVSTTGGIAIDGNKNITGGSSGGLFDGILALTAGGAINIGTTKTNGVITGSLDGIGAWAGTGPINIKVDKNVTGTTGYGIDAANALAQFGDVKIDILKPTTVVSGGTAGIQIATAGTGTINNAGIIKQIGDTGAANDPGGYAILSSFGTNTVNNKAGGQIIGSISTLATAGPFVLNNAAGATWTPGTGPLDTNVFGAASDTVNNAGLINIRTGITGFASGPLDNVFLDNKSGGVIDMRYGDGVSPLAATAKDSLYVNTFKAQAGSTLKVNVDFTQAHNTGTEQTLGGGVFNDRSTGNGGFGTADTIVTTSAAGPGTTSKIDLKTLGGAKVGSSGSIAIIDTAATGYAGIADPGLGGLPKLLANVSKHYVLINDPSTGAVKYALIEDALGGVSLVWAPNITASSLGGFGGATGVGTPGGPSAGAAIASASGAASGVGGLGNSGGPSGGGAAGHVADMAAGSALQTDDIADPGQGRGSLKDGGGAVAAEECTRARTAWGQGEASRSNFKGGGDGQSENFSGGVETGLGNVEGRGCNRVAVGVFGFAGTSDTSWATGSTDTDNAGAGAYIRASSALGLYGSLLGSWTWANSDLTNNVFGSTAKQDSDGFTGVATVGYVTRIAERSAIDMRTFVAYGNIDGDSFTDTQGITVSGSHDNLVTVGGSIGLYTALTDTVQGFVRGGVKWSQVDSSMTAFGITAKGSADETSGSVEAGFIARASEGVELGASGFGEFGDSTTGYGGRANISVRF